MKVVFRWWWAGREILPHSSPRPTVLLWVRVCLVVLLPSPHCMLWVGVRRPAWLPQPQVMLTSLSTHSDCIERDWSLSEARLHEKLSLTVFKREQIKYSPTKHRGLGDTHLCIPFTLRPLELNNLILMTTLNFSFLP